MQCVPDTGCYVSLRIEREEEQATYQVVLQGLVRRLEDSPMSTLCILYTMIYCRRYSSTAVCIEEPRCLYSAYPGKSVCISYGTIPGCRLSGIQSSKHRSGMILLYLAPQPRCTIMFATGTSTTTCSWNTTYLEYKVLGSNSSALPVVYYRYCSPILQNPE